MPSFADTVQFVEKCTSPVVEVHFLGVYLFGKLTRVSKKSVDLGVCTLLVTDIPFPFTCEFILLDEFG
jgi:hypothetical protein